MNQPSLTRLSGSRLVASAALLCVAGTASAFDFNGYFRGGPGTTNKNASRACYGLDGPGLKYRLGNECDIYGEFTFSESRKVDGVEYKAALMTNLWNGRTDSGSASFGVAQMYVEGRGYDVAPEATFWVGKKRDRADVHIVDTFFVEMNGVGAGFHGQPVGVGKLGMAYYHDDVVVPATGTGAARTVGVNRYNIDYADIPVNAGGKLRFVGTFTQGDFTGGTTGTGFTIQHNQENFLGLGGSNTFWVQFTQGSTGLNMNFGNPTASSSASGLRVVESFTWQQGAFGGQALALWQSDKDSNGKSTVSTSLGGRMSYAFTKNFKLLTELGISSKKPDGGAQQDLTKFTIAPTLSTGPGFWNRPELRLYMTTARWNNAANAAFGAGGLTGNGDGKTSGTSVGAQVEVWF
jgi:maltoporin